MSESDVQVSLIGNIRDHGVDVAIGGHSGMLDAPLSAVPLAVSSGTLVLRDEMLGAALFQNCRWLLAPSPPVLIVFPNLTTTADLRDALTKIEEVMR